MATVRAYVKTRFKNRGVDNLYLRIRKAEVDRMRWSKDRHNKMPLTLRISSDLTVKGTLSFDGAGRSCWISSGDYEALARQLQALGLREGSEVDAEIVSST